MKIVTIIAFSTLLVLFLIFSVISAYSFSKIYDSEWVCLAQQCVDHATGDEWVRQNCNPGVDNEMVCDFYIPSINQNITMPLKDINISNMVSCKTYECSSYALVSYSNKLREVK